MPSAYAVLNNPPPVHTYQPGSWGPAAADQSGKEGSFLICSFWLVSALAGVGEVARARHLMEKLLTIGSPLGLYAEEFEPTTARHVGNFPQAFSHLARIEAAEKIILTERLKEFA
ncbi:glycoside hydrolase family 15 protein [Dactylosporangium sp. NPDC049140]|uniref:glycoside hydrolase family 15 protein n=1 Tax=Dactylosporangium sp. NPDC049140 TaxID=3155647 RepID=UPI0033F592F4